MDSSWAVFCSREENAFFKSSLDENKITFFILSFFNEFILYLVKVITVRLLAASHDNASFFQGSAIP